MLVYAGSWNVRVCIESIYWCVWLLDTVKNRKTFYIEYEDYCGDMMT